MRNFRERYWRYSLFVLILGLGITICIELTPFLGGLLGAATIYVLLRRQMQVLTACRRWRRCLAASNINTEDATAAISDSTSPHIGILI